MSWLFANIVEVAFWVYVIGAALLIGPLAIVAVMDEHNPRLAARLVLASPVWPIALPIYLWRTAELPVPAAPRLRIRAGRIEVGRGHLSEVGDDPESLRQMRGGE